MVSGFQETTKIHDENHISAPQVKHSFNLVPLIFATNDVDIRFANLKVGHNVLIDELEARPHMFYEKDDIEKPFEDEECYNRFWLFGMECQVAKILCTVSLIFSIEEIDRRQWFGATLLRLGLLLRKGSYFS